MVSWWVDAFEKKMALHERVQVLKANEERRGEERRGEGWRGEERSFFINTSKLKTRISMRVVP